MKKKTLILAMALIAIGAYHSGAAEYTWTQTEGGTFAWNDAANWGGSGFPNGAGDVAKIEILNTADQKIELGEAITLGTLIIGNDGTSTTNRTLTNATGDSFALTFDSGVAGTPAEIVLGKGKVEVINKSTYKTTINLYVPIALTSDLEVDMGGESENEYQALSIKSKVELGSKNITFTGSVFGFGPVAFFNPSEIKGTGSIINNSSSSLSVSGKQNYSGKIILNGNGRGVSLTTLSLIDGAFTNASEIVLNGYLVNSDEWKGGEMVVGNNTSATDNPGQRLTHRRMTLNGGYVVLAGQLPKNGTANDWQRELEWESNKVSALNFRSGCSYLKITVPRITWPPAEARDPTKGNALYVETLERGRGASVYLFGPNATNKNFFAENADVHLVGSNANTGTMRKIVPWMTDNSLGTLKEPTGFATYDEATGFRTLDLSTEYATSITAGPNHNVSCGSFSITEDVTVNSFRLGEWNNINMGAGRTVTIASGGLFFFRNNTSFGQLGNSNAGTVNFGSAEGVICVWGNNTNMIGAVITGSDGFSKVNTGTLILAGNNTISGPVHVGGGKLRVGDGTYASNVGSGDVDVHAGAVLQISCADAIANSATVRLYNIGPDMYFGKMEIDAGKTETVRYLYLGDEGMPNGTYGGTGSGATHVLPQYFAETTGVLDVTGNASALGGETLITIR